MSYGPMAAMANTGTTALSSLFSKDLGDYIGKTFDNPLIGKIAGIAIPALLAGGTGAMFGGKYGWGNAVPAGIMALMSNMGGDESKSMPSVAGAQMGDGGVNNVGVPSTTFNYEDPTSITKQSLSEAATGKTNLPSSEKPSTNSGANTPASSSTKTTPGILGNLGELMKDPVGQLLISMALSNFASGALSNASGAESEYNQRRNRAQDQYNKQMGDINAIRSWYQ